MDMDMLTTIRMYLELYGANSDPEKLAEINARYRTAHENDGLMWPKSTYFQEPGEIDCLEEDQ